MKRERLERGLHWIVSVLNKQGVPFRITGGCAAKIYGSPRPVNDIDIDILEKDFDKLLPDIRSFIVWGPGIWNEDGKWDMSYIGLNYLGQEIDIGAVDKTKISNRLRTKWLKYPFDFSSNKQALFLGIKVPVINRADLVAYKQNLDGEHQKVDIESILRVK